MSIKSNIFLGIDVSKATLDISIAGNHLKIENSEEAISNFIKLDIAKKKISLCVLESTGGYEKLAIMLLSAVGIKVHRAHPNKVYAFAKVCNHFAKTDKLDAVLLEKYAEFINKEDVAITLIDKVEDELQLLRSVERDLEITLHAHQCRSHNLSGKALNHIKDQINSVKKQLEAIKSDIEQIIVEDDYLKAKQKLLISYQGVGKKIANSLIAELPELGRLDRKEIASLVGVAPKTNESGKKISKSHIVGGRFYIRKALYMAALVAARFNDKMKIFYQRLIKSGKAAKVALTAVMRKIIICLNAMLKNNKLYVK